MAQAKHGDMVRVHYTGKLGDGTRFDSSEGRDPFEFTVGEGKVIPGFEQAIVGMEPGDTKTVVVEAQEGYGERRDDLIAVVNRSELPSDLDPKTGDRLEMRRSTGESLPVIVMESTDETVTLDANHPLAGEDLTFEIELLEIV